jgi:hypothetical protein
MKKVLEALDNESTVVQLGDYVTDTQEFVDIVTQDFDGTVVKSDVVLEDNTIVITVIADTELSEDVVDGVISKLKSIAKFEYDVNFQVSKVRIGSVQYMQSTITVNAFDKSVEQRKVVESFVNESIDISDIMDSSVSSLSFEILKEIESSSKPFFNMNTFNQEVANQVAEYISDLESFADVLDDYKYELSEEGYSISIKPNVSFDFKDRSYQYQVMIKLVVGDSSIIKEFISSLKSNVKDFVKIQAKGNTINIATKFF